MKAERRNLEVVAPAIGGVTLDDGTALAADQMVGGGPSVLYDAVAVVVSAEGADELAADARRPRTSSPTPTPTASSSATPPTPTPCSPPSGIAEDSRDDGYLLLGSRAKATAFVEACRSLRHWNRDESQED